MPQLQIDPGDLTALKNHLAEYDAWDKERDDLSEAEGDGRYPSPSSWHDSDDAAVDILHSIAMLLKDVLGQES